MDASRTCPVCFTALLHVFSAPFPPGRNTVSPGNREQVELPRLALRVFIFSCVCSNLRLINAADPLLSGGGAACTCGPISGSAICFLPVFAGAKSRTSTDTAEGEARLFKRDLCPKKPCQLVFKLTCTFVHDEHSN